MKTDTNVLLQFKVHLSFNENDFDGKDELTQANNGGSPIQMRTNTDYCVI